ncbi:MAG TPA: hypothetical protein VF624_15085 [Tepidisphaeraceae bacterium]|jgi:hypothetical protein
MAATKTIAQKVIRKYALTWDGATLGWVQDVDPSGLKIKTVEKKIGEIGEVIVDHLIVGMEGTIKAVLEQCKLPVLREAIPWAAATGSIPLVPATQYDSCYARAKILNLHPEDAGDDLTEDINLLKAYPIVTLPKSGAGSEFANVPIEFMPYPDQAQLVATPRVMVYGYIGPIPE